MRNACASKNKWNIHSMFGLSFNNVTKKIISIVLKVLGVALGIVYMWGTLTHPYIEINIYTLYEIAPVKFGRIVIEFIKYFTNASIMVAMVAPFFNFKTTDKIVRYANPAIAIIRLIFSRDLITVALGPDNNNQFKIIEQFYVEVGLLLVISLIFWILFFFDGRERQSGKEIVRTSLLAVLAYILIGFINVPYSFFTGIFGPAMATAIDFTFPHRILIYSTIGLPLVLMFVLRNKPYNVRWYICLQMALASMFCFFRRYTFLTFKDPSLLPLHLCNTGVIIMSFAFIFRSKPAFYFAYLINILGAYFATFMPNKTGDIFYFESLSYWHNHLADICIPMLAVGIKVFDRPKLKYVLYALIGFSVYFVIAGYMDAKYYYRGIDYFFLNSDKFSSYAAAFEHIRLDFNLIIPIKGGNGQLVIKWLYWTLIYIVYCGLTFVMWFVYSLVYRISDSHLDCHNKIVEKRKLAKARKLYFKELKGGESND